MHNRTQREICTEGLSPTQYTNLQGITTCRWAIVTRETSESLAEVLYATTFVCIYQYNNEYILNALVEKRNQTNVGMPLIYKVYILGGSDTQHYSHITVPTYVAASYSLLKLLL